MLTKSITFYLEKALKNTVTSKSGMRNEFNENRSDFKDLKGTQIIICDMILKWVLYVETKYFQFVHAQLEKAYENIKFLYK